MSLLLDVSGPQRRSEALQAAAGAAAAGGLLIVPTDTVYGIAARLDRPDAVAALFEAKARPARLALPVLVGSLEQAHQLGVIDAAAEKLAATYWPGPLTIAVTKRPEMTADIGGDGATVGLRVPDHPVLLALLALTGPLATTSANLSGQPGPPEVAAIREIFGEAVAVYLDAGPAPGGVPSTVVSVTPPGIYGIERIKLVREGAIAFPDILQVAGSA